MKKFEDLKRLMESANNFLKNHVFEVYTDSSTDENKVPTKVKVELTDVKNYISIGDNKPFVQFTAYVLPTNETSDLFYSFLRAKHGREKHVKTFNYGGYESLAFVMQRKLSEFLKYFSLPDAILTKVVNEVEPFKLNESLITESRFDGVTRKLVKDILSFYKYQREGQFLLPEDLSGENFQSYKFPGIDNEFVIELNLEIDEDIDTIEVDAAYYREEDVIEITITSNPDLGYKNLEQLIGELNETVRHELEHIYQYQKGHQFPKKEPKSPIKYYLQPHELEAQRVGFKRLAKLQKKPLIDIIRNWFNKNQKRHRLSDKEVEKVIKKILEIS